MKNPNFKNREQVVTHEFTEYQGCVTTSPAAYDLIDREMEKTKTQVLKVKIGKRNLYLIKAAEGDLEFDLYEFNPPF